METCCICNENEGRTIKVNDKFSCRCNVYFHKKCWVEFLKNGGDRCPLGREALRVYNTIVFYRYILYCVVTYSVVSCIPLGVQIWQDFAVKGEQDGFLRTTPANLTIFLGIYFVIQLVLFFLKRYSVFAWKIMGVYGFVQYEFFSVLVLSNYYTMPSSVLTGLVFLTISSQAVLVGILIKWGKTLLEIRRNLSV
jgi:hypothetical protein